MLCYLILLHLIYSSSDGYAIISIPNCESNLNDTQLFIKCNSSQSNTNSIFNLPNVTNDGNLTQVEFIQAKNSFIQNIPINVCDYLLIKQLDLSNNLINNFVVSLNCLLNLVSLDLSFNQIRFISSNAFDKLNKLASIDLRNNFILDIPIGLFNSNLSSLKFIQLSNNSLSEFEMWPFTVPTISFVDLRFNRINAFTNRHSLFIDNNLKYTSNFDKVTIDLRFNKLNTYNDEIIQQYGVGSFEQFMTFINITIGLWLENNQFNCTCLSQQLISDYGLLLKENAINPLINIFKTTCTTPFKYFGLSIFEFDKSCSLNYSRPYQFFLNETTTTTTITRQTTTSSTTDLPILFELQRASDPNGLSSAQIAGITIGCLLFVALLIGFILFLSWNELLACCFKQYPKCYKILFKCYENDRVIENKFYDLFISYNQINDTWLNNTLIPYLTQNNIVNNFYLHYDENENEKKSIYSLLIEEKLENSSQILLILSDAYLENEWNAIEFRNKIRLLVESKQAKLVCIQMNDVTDDEFEEYILNEIRMQMLNSYEINEFCFWKKLNYELKNRIEFNVKSEYKKLDKQEVVKKQPQKMIKGDPLDFYTYSIDRPIINLDNNTQRQTQKKKFDELSKALETVCVDNFSLERHNDDDNDGEVQKVTSKRMKKYRKRNTVYSDSEGILSSNASITNVKSNLNLFLASYDPNSKLTNHTALKEGRVLPLSAILESQNK